MTGEGGDPRVTGDHVRQPAVPGVDGDVTLVGVVHDHPASVHRVRTVIEAAPPAVLALELPPLAVPLFEEYARDDRTPPAFGGEMSAAIQAAGHATIVGIDGPTLGFAGDLARRLVRERAAPATARSVLGSLASVTRHAVVCRLAATLAARTSLRLEVDSPVDHDASARDDPATQAADEDRQIARARAVMNALEPSRAAQYRDETREAFMARRLGGLRESGDVVAVVGIGHLDPIADRLADGEAGPGSAG